MSTYRNKIRMGLAAVIAAIAISAGTVTPSFASTCVPQARVLTDSALSPLAQIRISCPVLGAIVEEFAMQDLGESAPRETRHLLVAAAPFTGDLVSVAHRARQARDAGATMNDFGEALYLTAATVGASRAVTVTRVVLEVFAERDSTGPGTPTKASVSF